VALRLGPPLMPQGSDWPAAIALRDAARAQVLDLCGEPDLGPEFEASLSIPFPKEGV
jgi:hypothetical protein